VASETIRILGAVALACAAAAGSSQPRERVKYTVLERPSARVAQPQYRVTHEKDSTVVAIHAGQRPTGGYSVEVTGVERAGDDCTVRYRVRGPGPDDIVTQALTYPSVAIRIAASCREVTVDPPLPKGK
jgi:hypothetical protein